MLPLNELAFLPGFYSNATDRGAKGRFKGGNHVRFRYRLPEKVGGCTIISRSGGVAQVVGYAVGKIHGLARTLHDWVALDNTKWVSIGTHRKLYVFNDDLLYDITPLRKTVNPMAANPFSMTISSAEVVVTDVGHGAIAGDFVTFSGATAAGGITINGNYEITEVLTLDTYKIVHSSAATSTTTGGGAAVKAEYEITIGPSGFSLTGGYGMGPYSGPSGYGSPIVISEDEAAAEEVRFWSMDNWGEDLVAAPRGGRIYVWDKSAGPTVRATLIATSPLVNNWIAVAQEERILISFGSHDGVARDQLLIRWCDQEDYNTWTPTITNRAGDKRVQVGSRIITAVKTKREFVVFTDKAMFSMQFIGGNDVYSVVPVGESVAIAGPIAATEVDDVVYFMGKNNYYIYDGTLKTIPCDVWTFVFKDFNVVRAESVACRANQNFNEVQWFYPDSMNALNTRYAFYNTQEGTWVTGTWDRSAVHDYSTVFRRPYAVDSLGNFVRDEDGDNDVDANGAPASLDSYIESYDVEIGEGSGIMRANGLVPDFDELVGTGTVSLKGRKRPHGPQTTKGPLTVSSSTEFVKIQIRARQVSLRWDQAGINKRWRMGNWRIAAKAHGKR